MPTRAAVAVKMRPTKKASIPLNVGPAISFWRVAGGGGPELCNQLGIAHPGLANLDYLFGDDLRYPIVAIHAVNRERGVLIGRDRRPNILGLQRSPPY
jgi:hypothetical protein